MGIVEQARALAKAIQESDEYKEFMAAQDALELDTELKEKVGKFNLARVNLTNAASAENKDDALIEKYDQELKDIYNEVMSNPHMTAFTSTKQVLDSKMNFINRVLAAAMNGEDPDSVDEADGGCSGSCGSCAGGCH